MDEKDLVQISDNFFRSKESTLYYPIYSVYMYNLYTLDKDEGVYKLIGEIDEASFISANSDIGIRHITIINSSIKCNRYLTLVNSSIKDSTIDTSDKAINIDIKNTTIDKSNITARDVLKIRESYIYNCDYFQKVVEIESQDRKGEK